MKMTKMFYLMLLLMLLGTASMNAQVRIGGTGDPYDAAVLDLNANNDATPSGNTGGLALPRIALTSVTQQLNNATPKPGTLLYNTSTGLDGAGTYVWTTQWMKVSTGANAPVIITQPAKFSFKRLRDTDGDPNGPAALAAATTLTIVASNATNYTWYRKTTTVV
jgi:hypothetical protein